MKYVMYLTFASLLLFINVSNAQKQSFEEKAKILKIRIEKITADERAKLKETIKQINKRLNNNEISATQAQKLKVKAANNSALAIKNRMAVVEKQLRNLIQNKVDSSYYKKENSRRFSIGGFDIDYSKNYNRRHHNKYRNRRTSSSFVFAVGLNNLITNDAISAVDNSNFNFWSSHYFEIGSNNKTRIFKNSRFFYVDYGFSVVYTTLHPKNNQFFVVDNNLNKTFLQVNNVNLDKSKFKNVQLIFPVFLEMNFSRPYINNNNKVIFKPNSGFKIGLGGFIGLNLKTKQILKYKIDDIKTKDIKKGDFNVNNFLYGINAFVGIDDTSLFVRYNLNQLFNNSNLNQKNIAFGLLFNW